MVTPMPKGGTLYIMQVGHSPIYKIGMTTRSGHQRERELQRRFPTLAVALRYAVEVRTHCLEIERILHAFYAPCRYWGEWFVLPSVHIAVWTALVYASEQWLLEGHPVLAVVRQVVADVQRTLEGARHGARP